MQGRVAVGVLAAAAALGAPGIAGAATKEVSAGPFAQGPQFEQAVGDANEYFRRTVTIRRGDRVRWTIRGFHSVTFVPDGDAPPPLLTAADSLIAGVNDAAGRPFWFNGQPNLAFNPDASAPRGGKRFDPDELMSSGLPLAEGPPPPYTLKFRDTGTFRYLCTVHPGMEGKVRVVGKNRRIPSARQDRRSARRQLNATLQRVRALSAGAGTRSLQSTIQAGNDRRSGATVFKYFPTAPTYKVGDTVTLQMPRSTTEVHTFTFGPSNGENLYNDQLAASLLGPVFDPRGAYPSEPPTPAIPDYTGTLHGNGFYNSGFMDGSDESVLPSQVRIRFAEAGTFTLICLIHPFMRDTVTVTP